MIETRIPIVPDTSTTLTDETTEHIVNRKVTIKIDRDYLKKRSMQSYTSNWQKLQKKYPYTPKKTTCKKTGARSCKKTGWTILLTIGKITNKHCLLSEVKSTF